MSWILYFARRCRTMVLPPSKRQKAQKPHHCAVFLLLKDFIFFRVQDTFLLEKNSSLFSEFFLRAVQPAFSTVSSARLGRFLSVRQHKPANAFPRAPAVCQTKHEVVYSVQNLQMQKRKTLICPVLTYKIFPPIICIMLLIFCSMLQIRRGAAIRWRRKASVLWSRF